MVRFILPVTDMKAFFSRYKLWSCQNVCDALLYLLDIIIYIRVGNEAYRHIVGIPMGTNN